MYRTLIIDGPRQVDSGALRRLTPPLAGRTRLQPPLRAENIPHKWHIMPAALLNHGFTCLIMWFYCTRQLGAESHLFTSEAASTAMQSKISAAILLLMVSTTFVSTPLQAAEPFVPNDPYFFTDNPVGFPGQWHLDKQTSGAVVDINIRGAWERGLTGQGVVIGIVDDAFDYTHPDLAPNYDPTNSWDFRDNDADPSPMIPSPTNSDNLQGTAVAGLAVARGGNGIGVTGVAPYASFGALAVASTASGYWNLGDPWQMQALIDAMRFNAVGPNPTIDIKSYSYNNRLAYCSFSYPFARILEIALVESTKAGTIHVFGATNNRMDHGRIFYDGDANRKYLTHLPEAITVSAVNSQGRFTEYTSFGACVTAAVPSGETIQKWRCEPHNDGPC